MPPFRSSRAIMRGGGPVFRLKLALRSAVAMAIVGGILFGSAGRTDLPLFWAYLAVFAGFSIVVMLTISRELLEERYLNPGERGRDNLALLRATGLVVFLSQWICGSTRSSPRRCGFSASEATTWSPPVRTGSFATPVTRPSSCSAGAGRSRSDRGWRSFHISW